MAIPTAATPGYTTYAGKVACVCPHHKSHDLEED